MTLKTLQWTMVVVVLAVSIPMTNMSAEGADETTLMNKRITAVTESLKESKSKLKQYEWYETVTVAVDGEQKMQQQDRCYYGEDGVLQKVVVAATPKPKKKFGLRGRIAAKKQAEMEEFMLKAISRIHYYLPPDSKRLQLVKESGGVSFTILEPGKRIRIDFHNYRLPQDTLGIEIDLETNRLLRLRVSSYIDSPEDAFTCTAKFASLKDGTTYLSESVLDSKERELKVTVKNTGYRKMASN